MDTQALLPMAGYADGHLKPQQSTHLLTRGMAGRSSADIAGREDSQHETQQCRSADTRDMAKTDCVKLSGGPAGPGLQLGHTLLHPWRLQPTNVCTLHACEILDVSQKHVPERSHGEEYRIFGTFW